MRVGRKLQIAAVALLVAGYAGLSHYCNAAAAAGGEDSPARQLGTALALGPVTAGLLLTWRGAPRILAALLTAAAAVLLWRWWPVVAHSFPLLSLLEDSGVYLLLGVTFGRSLRSGHIALCTQLADRVHGPLSAQEVAYTRRVTGVWAGFFFIVAALSITLYLLAPLRVWSAYVNFCVLPLVALMFLAEYAVRRRALPQNRNSGLLATLRVYFAAPQRP